MNIFISHSHYRYLSNRVDTPLIYSEKKYSNIIETFEWLIECLYNCWWREGALKRDWYVASPEEKAMKRSGTKDHLDPRDAVINSKEARGIPGKAQETRGIPDKAQETRRCSHILQLIWLPEGRFIEDSSWGSITLQKKKFNLKTFYTIWTIIYTLLVNCCLLLKHSGFLWVVLMLLMQLLYISIESEKVRRVTQSFIKPHFRSGFFHCVCRYMCSCLATSYQSPKCKKNQGFLLIV